MAKRQQFTGSEAWRNGFSVNAADLIAIMALAAWDHETFIRALVLCGKYARGERVNERVALRVIQQINDEIEGEEIAKARRKAQAAEFIAARTGGR